jgi:hypothetical protein
MNEAIVMHTFIGIELFVSGYLVEHQHYGFALFLFGTALSTMIIRLGDRLERK